MNDPLHTAQWNSKWQLAPFCNQRRYVCMYVCYIQMWSVIEIEVSAAKRRFGQRRTAYTTVVPK